MNGNPRARLAAAIGKGASALGRFIVNLRFRGRVLAGTAALFALLVGARIHGSSIALAAVTWAPPEEAMSHFLTAPLLKQMDPKTANTWRSWLMAQPRWIRADEWAHESMWVLSQFTHRPKFPVVNGNVGDGQNMLVVPWVPVLHVSALARPLTWGYLLFGAECGLAWSWWFMLLSGFLGLYLLLEIIVPGRPGLALLGAVWFAGSAYIVCWSIWPAHVAAFGLFAVICAYRLATSTRPVVVLSSGVGLGLSVSGFVMQLYPPWLVPLAHAMLLIFVGLAVRDRLFETARQGSRLRVIALAIALVTAAIVFGSFLASSADALKAFAESDYPGRRRLRGEDTPIVRIFGALYNYFTNEAPPAHSNQSEAAGFFLFFPAVAVALAVSRRLRARLDLVTWLLLAYGGLLLTFGAAGLPEWLANLTLLSRSQGFRAQLALGLLSVVVSIQLLAAASRPGERRDGRSFITAALVFAACAALFVWQGAAFQQTYRYFPGSARLPLQVLAVSLGAALMCGMMALGLARLFGGLLVIALVLTSGAFNPLSRGFAPWRSSELGRAIASVEDTDPRPGGRPSLWLSYGGPGYPNAGLVTSVMGARALSGVYEYPQLDIWRPLDPTGKDRVKYNRYALVNLAQAPLEDRTVTFIQPMYLLLNVRISPLHPALRQLGARYVLTFGPGGVVKSPPFKIRYVAARGAFTIWELPDAPL